MKQAKKFPFIKIQKQRLQVSLENLTENSVPNHSDFSAWIWRAMKSKYAHARIGLVLLDKEAAQQYNLNYRNKDYATNILSFPYEPLMLKGNRLALQGDLLICPEVVEKEAKEQNKNIHAHYAHLTIHGTLHLLGYDHETDEEAKEMESIEIAILQSLGYANPYNETNEEIK